MKTKLLVIAAPFGYGPAARALLISHALCDSTDITLFSNMDALRFIERFRPRNTACRSGIFKQVYPEATDLENFDFFISLNNEPAVYHLLRHGFSDRTIFLDSVLPWRSKHIATGFPQPIRAYLAQDFPGARNCLKSCRAQTVELIAPTIWSPVSSDRADSDSPGTLTLHFGGVTSPVTGWQLLLPLVENITRAVLKLARRHSCRLVILGNPHLTSLTVRDEPDVDIMGGISPPEAAAIIGRSTILLSTPGISAIYEAFACRTPCLMLPPMNSTQLYQYKTFTESGLPGSIMPDDANELFRQTTSITWDKQSLYCIDWLNANLEPALGRLEPEIAQMLDPATGSANRAKTSKIQLSFFDRLSNIQAVDVIRRIIGAK